MAYPGGKNGSGVYQKIINQIPPHRVFISAFLGHCAIMRYKRAATVNIGIDSDVHVVEYWRSDIAQAGDVRGCTAPTVIHGDAISFLQSYNFQSDEFVYADPPYLMETRKSKRPIYNVEMGDTGQHEKLLSVLKSLPCMVALSGYPSSLYSELLQGWRTISYNTINRAGDTVREWLWMNYPEPQALHDYSYLGENFREREKITRQKRRWARRLRDMNPLQRYALMSSIAEFSDTAVTPN